MLQDLFSSNLHLLWEWINRFQPEHGNKIVILIVCSLGLLGIAKLLFDLVKAIAHRHLPAIFPSDYSISHYGDTSAGGMDSSYRVDSIDLGSIDCGGGDTGGGE